MKHSGITNRNNESKNVAIWKVHLFSQRFKELNKSTENNFVQYYSQLVLFPLNSHTKKREKESKVFIILT